MRKRGTTAGIPAPGEGKRGEDGHLGYLLSQAWAAHRLRLERAFAAYGVTVPQFSVLTMLNAYPGISNADVARLSLLTPQTVSVIVGNLERAGWLARTPHAVHGRIRHLDLTDLGRAQLARCRARAGALERRIVDGLSAADERLLRRWLVRVAVDAGAAEARD